MPEKDVTDAVNKASRQIAFRLSAAIGAWIDEHENDPGGRSFQERREVSIQLLADVASVLDEFSSGE